METFSNIQGELTQRGIKSLLGPLTPPINRLGGIPVLDGKPHNVVSVAARDQQSVVNRVYEAQVVFMCYANSVDAAWTLAEAVESMTETAFGVDTASREVTPQRGHANVEWPCVTLTVGMLWRT